MSLSGAPHRRRVSAGALAVALSLLVVSPALAQRDVPEEERFFADKEPEEADENEAVYQGSLTSTNFVYRETGAVGQPLALGAVPAETASPVNRLFTDLRAQLGATNIVTDYDFRFDGRARLTGDGDFQSGVYGGNEYELRETYIKRRGDGLDVTLGRQYVLDLAATKIDGVRIDYRSSKSLSYIAFAGFYPSRTSRSYRDDYVNVPVDPADPALGNKRIMPYAGGAGAAYRYQRMYGALGIVGILPNGQDNLAGAEEPPRVFVTANGYYRHDEKLDIYHYLVFDVEGSAARQLTNLTLGANYKPTQTLRVTGQVTQVDTETLNIIAQDRLEDPDPTPIGADLVVNNIEVMRIASRSARVGVSLALAERRFEVSTSGTVRDRGDIELTTGGGNPLIIPASRAAEIMFSVVDRRSLYDLRLGASLIAIRGLGDVNLQKSTSNIVQVFGSRELEDGKAAVEGTLQYLAGKDENRQLMCNNPNDILNCYGTSTVTSLGATALLYYRLAPDWFAVASGTATRYSLTVTDGGMDVKQPPLLGLSGFLRLAYRF